MYTNTHTRTHMHARARAHTQTYTHARRHAHTQTRACSHSRCGDQVVADLSEAAELRVCEYDALTGSYDASPGGRTFGLTRIALLAAVPGEVGSTSTR